LTRALQEKPTEPAYYQQIFERGIDPDVEDPEQCHMHSETPDEWPPFGEILDYQERVRNRARLILQEGYADQDRSIGEALWIGFEHEAMHLETFLYMLLQSDKALPPNGVERPDFEKLSTQAKLDEKPNKWFSIPQQTFTIGLDDCDEVNVPVDSFGWDNEKPQREVTVGAFESQARPITNGEYAKYLQVNGIQTIPASWVLQSKGETHINKGIGSSGAQAGSSASPAMLPLGDVSIRTIFGPVSLSLAQDWPLSASYDELASYAKWMNCRIPTFEETRSIYHYVDQLRDDESRHRHRYVSDFCYANMTRSNMNNSNGVNGSKMNGSKPCSKVPVFRDLDGCNVGFKNWHPTPVTPNGDRLAGQGDMGGLWEWTSTPLMPHEGFKSMDIYPGYTCELHSRPRKRPRLTISRS
jgi:formylglycine-generating enzyme required for sulfatase activity